MQAMNGSAVSFRRSGRLIGCCMALVLSLSALAFASSASAAPSTYVALGDSLAFGYSQQLFNENEKAGDPPAQFEHGYVNYYYKAMKPKANSVALVNDGCPGETSSSLIGNGPLGAALHASPFEASEEAPCAYHTLGLPLHHEYGAGKSQLESALETVAVAELSGSPVSTITLNIGANDELATVHGCEAEVGAEYAKEGKSKYGATPEEAVKNCLTEHVPGLIEKLVKNIGATIYTLRNGATFGGVNYTGQICYVASYDPYGAVFTPGVELLPESKLLAGQINSNVIEKAVDPFGGESANMLAEFNPGGAEEPTRLKEWTNMANFTEFEGKKNGPDIHATPAGYREMAKVMKNKHACKPAV